MILHLLQDDKITNRMISNFEEALPGENIYMCIIPHDDYNLQYIDVNTYNIILQTMSSQPSIDCSIVDKVFIHFLTLQKIDFCNKYINESATIFWGLWGADLYNKLLFCRGYRLYSSVNYKSNFKNTFVDFLRIFKFRVIHYHKFAEFINKRISYIGGLNCDFKLVIKYLRCTNKHHFNIPGYGIDEILGSHLIDKTVDNESNLILCGNSASFTNNHKYVIKYLKRVIDGHSCVKMILSYGGDKKYIKAVIKNARKNLGSCFDPITEFMPLDTYNTLISSARICVYGNWRQEAVGNIVVSLYLGAKVYLSKYSPLLKELTSIGYKVFVLEDATQKSFYEKLDPKWQLENRKVAIKTNNHQSIIKEISRLFGNTTSTDTNT